MKHTRLKDTDLDVSAICMGCWAISDGRMWGEQDEADAMAAIAACLDSGVNFFDTAEAYGKGLSEQMLGRGLGSRRNEAVVATKVSPSNLDPKRLRQACDRSLKNLGTDCIDLYQIHWPSREVPVAESLGAMEDLKAAGKIRAYGVSNFGPIDLSEALQYGRVATDQMSYSLLFRAVEFELQDICEQTGVGILCYSPICQGLLAGKFATPEDVPDERARFRLFSKDRPMARHGEDGCEREMFDAIGRIREISEGEGRSMAELSIAWLLAQPGVASAIVGCRNAAQAAANAKAGDIELSQSTLDDLSEATRPIKEKMGSNMDMWQTDSRIR